MGVFGAVFGRRGDAGFKAPLLGVSSGVVGFNVAMLSRLVREKVLPAWPDGGREREKVRPVRSQWLKIGVFWRAGRVFSRTGSRGIPPGEHCRAAALAAGHSTGSVNPSMRSYTHLAEAGRGRPTDPSNPPRNAKR